MAVDLMGGVFSLLSLAFKEHFDVIAAVAYGAVVVSLVTLSSTSTTPPPSASLRSMIVNVDLDNLAPGRNRDHPRAHSQPDGGAEEEEGGGVGDGAAGRVFSQSQFRA